MSQPQVANDIMTSEVLSCSEDDSLAHAHQLMKENQIRHLPILNEESGDYVGLITQKEILKQAFAATAQKGIENLQDTQAKVLVKEIMVTDVETIQPQLPLLNAGEYFVESKHGCLPVVVDGKLKGILTSADFVKLSVTLLQASV